VREEVVKPVVIRGDYELPDGTPYCVELTVDAVGLLDMLARSALTNKGGKATASSGLVKAVLVNSADAREKVVAQRSWRGTLVRIRQAAGELEKDRQREASGGKWGLNYELLWAAEAQAVAVFKAPNPQPGF